MSPPRRTLPDDRFVAVRFGELVLAADDLASLVAEVERLDLDPRTLVIEHTGGARRQRVF